MTQDTRLSALRSGMAWLVKPRRNAVLLGALTSWATLSYFRGFGKTPLHTGDVLFGMDLLAGRLPETPGYPMWGYPLLIGLLGNAVVFVQLAVALIIALWIVQLVLSQLGVSSRRGEFVVTLLLVAALVPWFWLVLSYTSSAPLSLILIAAYLVLVGTRGRQQELRSYALAGLLFGLAYNFRTEALSTFLLAASATLLWGLHSGSLWQWAKNVATMTMVTALCIAPYVVYTAYSLASARVTTTNRGAVLYDQLGILPSNPWNITASDEFAYEEARAFTDEGPWFLEADLVFAKRFREAVAAYPGAFCLRLLAGLKENLRMGLHLPRMEELLGYSEADAIRADLVREELKGKLGLNVNPYDIQKAARRGFHMHDIRPSDRRIILIELVLRAFYVCLWILLCGLSLIGLFRKGLFSWESLLAMAFLGALFLISVFVCTGMRTTTGFLPVALLFVIQAHSPSIHRLFSRRVSRGR